MTSMTDLKGFVAATGLVDAGFSGSSYTWCNKKTLYLGEVLFFNATSALPSISFLFLIDDLRRPRTMLHL